jgi:saccharopine dehydrogenase-like NADP-dependent oxidoreductase
MKKVLVLGAGRSSQYLIDYLLDISQADQYEVMLTDREKELAAYRVQHHSNGRAIVLDVSNEKERDALIQESDLVISMLPINFHLEVAKACLKYRKNMVTASYVSPEINQLNEEVKRTGLIFLKECGLDPGIDHMSAMSVIDKIRNLGGNLRSFETFTGGLLVPSPDENPWQYKFTWNPRNVVLAGQGGVKFLQEGAFKYIPYHKIFRRTEMVHIPGHGYFEGYANRDSLKYLKLYNLEGIKTMYRGTFRRPGFCRAWDIFVQIGATDDSYMMDNVKEMTHKQFINSFLSYNPYDSVELKLAHYLNLDFDSLEMYKLRWLHLFDEEPVGLEEGTPAQILEHILKKRWTLDANDRDLIVMWHKFEYFEEQQLKVINSYLTAEGENNLKTAMARTVGLPVGIAARLILKGKIGLKGVHIPTKKEIYEPILHELKTLGVEIQEELPRLIKMPGKNL